MEQVPRFRGCRLTLYTRQIQCKHTVYVTYAFKEMQVISTHIFYIDSENNIGEDCVSAVVSKLRK